jgi:hypothetical protein
MCPLSADTVAKLENRWALFAKLLEPAGLMETSDTAG